jgi:hypothetical protein
VPDHRVMLSELPHTTETPAAPAEGPATPLQSANEPAWSDSARHIYQYVSLHGAGPRGVKLTRDYLRAQLENAAQLPCELPRRPDELEAWVSAKAAGVHERYADYLHARRQGAPRHYFTNRSHALYFLRGVAPTKLVDGAWLYGLTRHWKNPAYHGLLKIYLEELGEGDESKNHVLLYRKLLAAHGCEQWQDLPDAFYTQGALQLALGFHADDFLPEVVGFNLGYEQLPLHLLITAYELNELGIDPYYFTLHVTVDNAASGHARRAAAAVTELLPQFGDSTEFWARVRRGYALNDLGMGTVNVVRNFDIEQEVVDIFMRKSVGGHGAHSDYCKVAGRTVNDWLSAPEQVPYFLDALKRAGWIEHGPDARKSRFWGLLQGERAQMFGVFSSYELQMIHDWLRGPASADGMAYSHSGAPDKPFRQPSFRALERQRPPAGDRDEERASTDPDTHALHKELAQMPGREAMTDYLACAISPLHHWKPAGLAATRLFSSYAFG